MFHGYHQREREREGCACVEDVIDAIPLLLSLRTRSDAAVSRRKLWRLGGMGVVTAAYTAAELAISLKLGSLTMFSDALHHVSDSLALVIAFTAEKRKSRSRVWTARPAARPA